MFSGVIQVSVRDRKWKVYSEAWAEMVFLCLMSRLGLGGTHGSQLHLVLHQHHVGYV